MSATMIDAAPRQLPHRKPVPGRSGYNHFQQSQQPSQQQQAPAPYGSDQQRAYTRTSTSSSVSPQPPTNSMYSMPPQQQQQAQYPQRSHRTLSNATSSTTSTNPNGGLQCAPTNSSQPRRSTSSRSNSSASPTSYVALMRKQKATVWCDRAQQEDPLKIAKIRNEKMRAQREVAGSHRFSGSGNNPAQSVGIRSMIRHHGAPKASTYSGQANLSGAGVPMRLSASEVDDNDSEEEDSKYMNYHERSGSRGSSLNSGRHKPNNYLAPARGGQSNGSTPNAHSPSESMGDLQEEETPVPNEYNMGASNYFESGGSGGSGGSDTSTEAEQQFGRLAGLPQSTAPKVDHERTTSEDLRRRGSVDDRTMTMSGVRLFVANPDLSD
ncbi:hypothetical protein LTR37_012199 [Vermiconidia calcicola]|uniref:Uncharacterized protein n=1 Tax=Vermiconidia calcicola TaxID=1690605 RepID=A0ACC3N004_9PEZI|nr:hypothetical protein LTR37_012199 [Vermiconidia calcicola]